MHILFGKMLMDGSSWQLFEHMMSLDRKDNRHHYPEPTHPPTHPATNPPTHHLVSLGSGPKWPQMQADRPAGMYKILKIMAAERLAMNWSHDVNFNSGVTTRKSPQVIRIAIILWSMAGLTFIWHLPSIDISYIWADYHFIVLAKWMGSGEDHGGTPPKVGSDPGVDEVLDIFCDEILSMIP